MSGVDEYWENEQNIEQAIDVFSIVHNQLYFMEQSIRREIKQQTGHEIGPGRFSSSGFALDRELDQQTGHEIESQRKICYDIARQRCILQLVCREIFKNACHVLYTRPHEKEFVEELIRNEIAARASIRIHKRLFEDMGVMNEQRPLKILHRDLPSGTTPNAVDEPVEDLPPDTTPNAFDEPMEDVPTDTTPNVLDELVHGMHVCTLDDDIHKNIVKGLLVDDPKRKLVIPSRFCSFHLDGFDLDEKSTTPLGPPYQPADCAAENAHQQLASYAAEVVSIRVIKAHRRYTYPVEVYGTVIARDEIDFKCVYLFDRERSNAQTINSDKDMLALTGPYRVLVTLAHSSMYFEFDLKIKGKDGPDEEVQFSKGVISYFCALDRKRIILQLPSFQSTVKLLLQHVDHPLAASLEVSVVKQGPNDPLVHFEGKIIAGTTRNYRQHTLLYDSSVCGGGLVGGNGSPELNRNLVAVNGYVQYPASEEDEKLVLYVCFLDAGCEIEDEDWAHPVFGDYDDDDDEEKDEEKEEAAEAKDVEEEDEVEENPKNVVTLKYPLHETVWEHGCHKLKVKVDWTAVLGIPRNTDFLYRRSCLPKGYLPNYQCGIF